MTIIRTGKLPNIASYSPTVYRGECINCCTIVECSIKELYRVPDVDGWGHCKCPTDGCESIITMRKK